MRTAITSSVFLLAAVLLSGCGMRDPINVMTAYDASTMDCDAAGRIARLAESRSVMQQIARAKVSFCEAWANDEGTFPVGYFDAVEGHYEFRALDLNDATTSRQLCLDLALEADISDFAPTNYRFATEFGEFSCEELPIELSERGAVPVVAPSYAPLHIDVDPVLVHASGANPRLDGVPKHYYDDVRERLAELIEEYDP